MYAARNGTLYFCFNLKCKQISPIGGHIVMNGIKCPFTTL